MTQINDIQLLLQEQTKHPSHSEHPPPRLPSYLLKDIPLLQVVLPSILHSRVVHSLDGTVDRLENHILLQHLRNTTSCMLLYCFGCDFFGGSIRDYSRRDSSTRSPQTRHRMSRKANRPSLSLNLSRDRLTSPSSPQREHTSFCASYRVCFSTISLEGVKSLCGAPASTVQPCCLPHPSGTAVPPSLQENQGRAPAARSSPGYSACYREPLRPH